MSESLSRRGFLQSSLVAGAAGAYTLTAAKAMRADDPPGLGRLTGRFLYDGTAPEPKKLKVDKDLECCGKFDIRDESLVVGPDGGLANVFVYLRSKLTDIPAEVEKAIEPTVLLDNLDCIFIPHCMALWYSKQTYHIVNSDPVGQSVAFSPAMDKPANIPLPVGATADWTFNRAQRFPVKVLCNYHPWELAYVLPCETPYFAISDKTGRFEIPMLPPGSWEFQLWHERAGYLNTSDWPRGRLEVTVKAGENDLGQFKLSPELFEV